MDYQRKILINTLMGLGLPWKGAVDSVSMPCVSPSWHAIHLQQTHRLCTSFHMAWNLEHDENASFISSLYTVLFQALALSDHCLFSR